MMKRYRRITKKVSEEGTMKKKFYYGFLWYGGPSTTWGDTRYIAGELHLFRDMETLNQWIDKAFIGSSGNGGGRRARITRAQAIKMLGVPQVEETIAQAKKEEEFRECVDAYNATGRNFHEDFVAPYETE